MRNGFGTNRGSWKVEPLGKHRKGKEEGTVSYFEPNGGKGGRGTAIAFPETR